MDSATDIMPSQTSRRFACLSVHHTHQILLRINYSHPRNYRPSYSLDFCHFKTFETVVAVFVGTADVGEKTLRKLCRIDVWAARGRINVFLKTPSVVSYLQRWYT
jgi:hypothetical protein